MLNAGGDTEKGMITIIQRNSLRINQLITELLDATKAIEMVFERHSLQEIMETALLHAIDRINLQKINLSKSVPLSPFLYPRG
jgi:signal transduction histidine kinase